MNKNPRRGRWMLAAPVLAAVVAGGAVGVQGMQSASAATTAAVHVRAASPSLLAVVIVPSRADKSSCIPIQNDGTYTNTGFMVPTGESAAVQLLLAESAGEHTNPCDYNYNRYVANTQEVVPDGEVWRVDFGNRDAHGNPV